MSATSENRTTGEVHDRSINPDEGDRSAQEQAKQEAALLRLAKPVPANARREIEANRLHEKDTVTLHLPDPINAALRGSQGTFRRFVPGWDQVWTGASQSEPGTAMLQDFSLMCGFPQPLSLRHTISSPNQPTSTPAGVCVSSLGPDEATISPDFPPITLDPFQRSTSTPGYSSTSFGTSASAFSIANNSFVRIPSMAREQRHSTSAFGPAQFYSLALEDAMERTAIEVEHRPETCATTFLSSNVQILRRRRRRQVYEGDEQPLPVTVVEETEPVVSLVVPDGDAPNTSALSGCSELSTLLHEDEKTDDGEGSATLSETNGQVAMPRDENVTTNTNRCSVSSHLARNLQDRDSPRTTHSSVTGSGSSTLALSTISETDREVAEANKLAEKRRNQALGGDCDSSSGSSSTSTHRYLALGGSGVRDGATLPVDRLFSQNTSPGPMFRFRTSSSTSSSQRSGTATTYRSASATASSVASSCPEYDPPVFVSYSPSRPTHNELIVTPSGDNYRLPAAEDQPRDESPLLANMMESEVLFADTGAEGQYRIRSRYVPPQGPRQTVANEHSVEVSVDGVAGTGETTAVITPEKEDQAASCDF